jgi:hypothetical protein
MPDKKEKDPDLFEGFLKDQGSVEKQFIKERTKPLMSELNLISDKGLREIIALLLAKSDYFWTSPVAAVEDMSPPDEYEPGGLVKHVKRVTRAAFFIASSQIMEEEDIMILISAALLHAVAYPLAHNDTPGMPQVYNDYYAIAVDKYVQDTLEISMHKGMLTENSFMEEQRYNILIEKIVRLIHCCEGVFSPISEVVPETSLEIMMASAKIVGKSIHVIVDGPDVISDRWEFDEPEDK